MEMTKTYLPTGLLIVFSLLFLLQGKSYPEEIDCLLCHEQLTTGKSVHQAVGFGCAFCHSDLDASEIPHKITGHHSRGLSSTQKELCYSCHEQSRFMKKNFHLALLLGCTSCHDPHSSEEVHLLKAGMPDLCMRCHEKKLLTAKAPHDSIGDTSCSMCHDPHATDGPKLLLYGELSIKSASLAQGISN